MLENLAVLFVESALHPNRQLSHLLLDIENRHKLPAGIPRNQLSATLRSSHIDLVVADCDSKHDGLELLGLVWESRPQLPVILVCTAAPTDLVVGLLNAGAFDVIVQGNASALGHSIERATTLAKLAGSWNQGLAYQQESRSLQAMISSAFDAIITIDESQRIVLFNPSAEAMFGYTAQEVRGQPVAMLLPVPFQTGHADHVRAFGDGLVSTRKMGQITEVLGRRRNGEEFPVEASTSNIQYSGPTLFVAILRDVTERVSLEKSKGFLAAIVESADDAVIAKNLDGTVVSWNPAATRLFGYLPSEMIGGSITTLIPEDRLNEETIILDCIKQGDRVANYESRRIRKDGAIIDVSLTISPIKSPTGEIVGASKMVRDITERLAADRREKHLRALYSALSRTNEAIVRLRDPAQLYQAICQICVEHGHAKMAFIGLIREDRVSPTAWAGPGQDFLAGAKFPLDASAMVPLGPVASVAITGLPYICNDYYADPNTIPWREKAARIGSNAVAVLPFSRNGKIAGILSLHVTEKDFFNQEIVGLLTEMASNLSFALDGFDRDAARAIAEQSLRESEESLAGAQALARLGNWYWNKQSGNVLWSKQMHRVLGIGQKDLPTSLDQLLQLVHPADREFVYDAKQNCSVLGMSESYEGRLADPSNVERWISVIVKPKRDSNQRVVGLEGTAQDITDRKIAEHRIEYLATHDALTDLPNGLLARDRISQAIQQASRSETYVALILVDLDRFKFINDAFGHAIGDTVLKAVGARLKGCVDPLDTVARLGSDEFLIVVSAIHHYSGAYMASRRILESFDTAISSQGPQIFLTASLGVTIYPDDGEDAEVLINNADIAMYGAKAAGRNTTSFFTPAMSAENARRVELETCLRTALERNELAVHYQPKVDLRTGEIYGVEALLRWTHPTLGPVSPQEFIPVAEESGLITSIGDWVLSEACSQNKAWLDAGVRPIVMSVNLSPKQFLNQDIVGQIAQVLHKVQLPERLLELELTESLISLDIDRVAETLKRLKLLGVQLSIDDFGTGFSSLSYLQKFRVDALKIDQSFVRNMLVNDSDAAITSAVIALAHSLKMSVVAEGVESATHCQILAAGGCDAIQGYYFMRPAGPEGIEAALRSNLTLTLAPV
jgi:diguanylate cyclase (GGDEF)-like protein/PAS domain S-box-containing protein